MKNRSIKTEYCAFLQKNCIQKKCAFWLDACQNMEAINPKEGFSVLAAVNELIQANPEFEADVFTGKGTALRNFLAFSDPSYGRYILRSLSTEAIVRMVLSVEEMDFTIPAKEEISGWNVVWIDKGNDDFGMAIDEKAHFIKIRTLTNIFRMLPSWGMIEDIKAKNLETGHFFERISWWVFSDLKCLDDKSTQEWLKYVTEDQLVLALKTALEELKEKIFTNMTDKAAKRVQDAYENMGPASLQMVEQAQNAILDYVIALVEKGEIRVPDKNYQNIKQKQQKEINCHQDTKA